jgi:hypothetical protein
MFLFWKHFVIKSVINKLLHLIFWAFKVKKFFFWGKTNFSIWYLFIPVELYFFLTVKSEEIDICSIFFCIPEHNEFVLLLFCEKMIYIFKFILIDAALDAKIKVTTWTTPLWNIFHRFIAITIGETTSLYWICMSRITYHYSRDFKVSFHNAIMENKFLSLFKYLCIHKSTRSTKIVFTFITVIMKFLHF